MKQLIFTEQDDGSVDVNSFRLSAPCPDCPFRSDRPDLKGWLGRERAMEIARSVIDWGQSFPCHKTTAHQDDEEDAGYVYKGCEAQCAGASILQLKLDSPSQWMQVAERLNLTTEIAGIRRLDLTAPVFDTVEEFIEFHT